MIDFPKKYYSFVTNLLYVLLSVGFIVISIFPEVTAVKSTVFTIPFRILVLLLAFLVILKNILAKTFKIDLPIIVMTLFWLFYGFKAYYSFQHYEQLQTLSISEILQRVYLINFIPIFAVLVNRGRDVNYEIVFKAIYTILFMVVLANFFAGIPRDDFGRSHGIHSIYTISFGHIGASLSLLSLYPLFFKRDIKPLWKILLLFGFASGLIIIYFSNTRSPVLALIIVTFLIFFVKKDYKKIIVFLSFVVMAIAALYIAMKDRNVQIKGNNLFLERIYNSIFQGDTSQRGGLYYEAIQGFLEKPIFGKSILFSDGMYPHNIYLEVLMAMGIVGFVMIAYIHANSFKKLFILAKNKEQNERIWIGILFLQYYILSITSYNIFGNTDVWFYLAMLWAIPIASVKNE